MSKRLVLSAALTLAILSLFSRAHAEKYFFVTLEFPPLEYRGEKGNPKGIAVDTIKRIASLLGHSVDIRIYPWARSLKMVETGKADAIFTIYRNEERESYIDFSQQVLVPQIVSFYEKKGSSIAFNGDFKEIENKTIGVISTISYGKRFDSVREKLNIYRVEKLEHNFRKLILGRIDLFISNIYMADWELGKAGLKDKITRLPVEVERVPSYIGFSKKKGLGKIRDKFDRELLIMKENGEYAAIVKNYGLEGSLATGGQ